jgi:hypothetical protein
LLPSDEASRTSVTELVMAVRQYGERPELYALHAKAARSLFESRYTVERVASVCAEAYAAAKNLLPFPEREMTEGVGNGRVTDYSESPVGMKVDREPSTPPTGRSTRQPIAQLPVVGDWKRRRENGAGRHNLGRTFDATTRPETRWSCR